MIANRVARGLVMATALVGLNSLAQTDSMMKFEEMKSVKMMDTNKDGMVSRAEFLDAAGKMYDMKAKEMKAKPAGLNAAEISAFWSAMFKQ